MLRIHAPLALFCIALVAFAPLIGAGADDLCAVLVPLWLGGADGRVVLLAPPPIRAAEQPLSLFSLRASRAPPSLLARA